MSKRIVGKAYFKIFIILEGIFNDTNPAISTFCSSSNLQNVDGGSGRQLTHYLNVNPDTAHVQSNLETAESNLHLLSNISSAQLMSNIGSSEGGGQLMSNIGTADGSFTQQQQLDSYFDTGRSLSTYIILSIYFIYQQLVCYYLKVNLLD